MIAHCDEAGLFFFSFFLICFDVYEYFAYMYVYVPQTYL